MVLLGLSLSTQGGVLSVSTICTSSHMTDMKAINDLESLAPKVNRIDFVKDTALLATYSLDNFFIPATLMIMTGFFVLFAILAHLKDRCAKEVSVVYLYE